MASALTDSEREAVVEEAIRLIKRPENFTQGTWKCPLWRRVIGDKEEIVAVDSSAPFTELKDLPWERYTDEEGRPQFAYCVEGAINQAGVNILGTERARVLGALPFINTSLADGSPDVAHTPEFIENLSVNEVARVMFAELIGDAAENMDYEDDVNVIAARVVNDIDMEEGGPEAKAQAHEHVLQMLRERRRQLREAASS